MLLILLLCALDRRTQANGGFRSRPALASAAIAIVAGNGVRVPWLKAEGEWNFSPPSAIRQWSRFRRTVRGCRPLDQALGAMNESRSGGCGVPLSE